MIASLRKWLSAVVWTAGVVFVVIAQPLYLLPMDEQLPIIFAAALVGLFAKKPFLGKREDRASVIVSAVIDGALIVATILAGLYLTVNYLAIIFRQGAFTHLDVVVAVVASIVAIEAVRRAVGWSLTIVALVFVVYALFGRIMPGPLINQGYNISETASELGLSYAGLLGTPLQIMVRYVILFLVFGSLLQASGAATFLVQLAQVVSGRYTGGLGKVAVMASALVGSISGSAAGNVATAGSVTIPAMKQGGYKPYMAAAIEACASTGGQIMPPVMGAAAFLMADYLGVPYLKIAIAAIVPALLYFLSVGMGVDLYARAEGIKGMKEGIVPLRTVVRNGWIYLIPILVIFVLLFLGYSPTLTAFVGVLVTVGVAFVRRVGWKDALRALSQAGENAAILCVVAAGAGVVVGVTQLTGLGASLSSILVQLSAGKAIILLLLAMVTSIIMGMGMPTTVVYVLLAALVVPALVTMGLQPLGSHFFIFYFGCLAAITPPVALATYAAASIAGSPINRTGWAAMRMALPAFIVPFFFVVNPALFLQGPPVTVVVSVIGAILGIGIFSTGMMNYLYGRMPWWLRIILVGAALLLIQRGWVTDVIGLVIFFLVAALRRRRYFSMIRQEPVDEGKG